MNTQTIITGESDFRKMIRDGAYVFDKTKWIRRIFEDGRMVSLITRPRRFGKTFTQYMLQAFFELNYDDPSDTSETLRLFDGMEILEEKDFCQKHMARWPVVFLSFKDVDGDTFEQALTSLALSISHYVARYEFLLNSPKLTSLSKRRVSDLLQVDVLPYELREQTIKNSIVTLTTVLQKHCGRPCMVLLDEYDVPLNRARTRGYYQKMQLVVREMLGRGLKDAEAVSKAVVTGCLRIAKESIFTDLNNFRCHALTDPYLGGALGFTSAEAHQILKRFGLESYEVQARAHYDGYRFGEEEIYCPWDLLNFCSDAVLNCKPIYGNYWINTSANDIIEEFIQYADDSQLKLMKQLLEGKTVEVQIFEELSFSELEAKHSTETLLSLLFAAGYLTSVGKTEEGLHILRIPNEEVRKCFERRLVQWFSKGGKGYQAVGNRLKSAFVAGDFYGAQSCLQTFLFKCASVRDGSTEAFYHGTVLGLLGGADPDGVTSNQESGEGYYDILYADSARSVGVIIELKKAKSDDCEVLLETSRQGLQQIYQRRYYARFLGTNIRTVQLCGVAFSGKMCRIVGETKEVASLA